MEAIIEVGIAAIGSYFYGMDFCTLYTFVALAISIYNSAIQTKIKLRLR